MPHHPVCTSHPRSRLAADQAARCARAVSSRRSEPVPTLVIDLQGRMLKKWVVPVAWDKFAPKSLLGCQMSDQCPLDLVAIHPAELLKARRQGTLPQRPQRAHDYDDYDDEGLESGRGRQGSGSANGGANGSSSKRQQQLKATMASPPPPGSCISRLLLTVRRLGPVPPNPPWPWRSWTTHACLHSCRGACIGMDRPTSTTARLGPVALMPCWLPGFLDPTLIHPQACSMRACLPQLVSLVGVGLGSTIMLYPAFSCRQPATNPPHCPQSIRLLSNTTHPPLAPPSPRTTLPSLPWPSLPPLASLPHSCHLHPISSAADAVFNVWELPSLNCEAVINERTFIEYPPSPPALSQQRVRSLLSEAGEGGSGNQSAAVEAVGGLAGGATAGVGSVVLATAPPQPPRSGDNPPPHPPVSPTLPPPKLLYIAPFLPPSPPPPLPLSPAPQHSITDEPAGSTRSGNSVLPPVAQQSAKPPATIHTSSPIGSFRTEALATDLGADILRDAVRYILSASAVIVLISVLGLCVACLSASRMRGILTAVYLCVGLPSWVFLVFVSASSLALRDDADRLVGMYWDCLKEISPTKSSDVPEVFHHAEAATSICIAATVMLLVGLLTACRVIGWKVLATHSVVTISATSALVGAATFALGLVLKLTAKSEDIFFDGAVMGLGGSAVLISLMGIVGVACESPCLLRTYALALLALLAAIFGGEPTSNRRSPVRTHCPRLKRPRHPSPSTRPTPECTLSSLPRAPPPSARSPLFHASHPRARSLLSLSPSATSTGGPLRLPSLPIPSVAATSLPPHSLSCCDLPPSPFPQLPCTSWSTGPTPSRCGSTSTGRTCRFICAPPPSLPRAAPTEPPTS